MTHAGLFGADLEMVTKVFRPAGAGPFPVVVFSHGRASDVVDRAKLTQGVSEAQLRWWLARGAAVVSPIRSGYGATGGTDVENSYIRLDERGECRSRRDYARVAEAQARTVEATLAWIATQPWADPQRVPLVGQSAGGLTTVAAAATAPAGVVGYINFAGGSGGNPTRSPGRSCDPEQLTRLYERFGKTTTMPNLWVYAQNDQYGGPDAPAAWHAAFARGGSPTTFFHAPPLADGDGHGLSRHAAALWAPTVEAFLQRVRFLSPPPAATAPPAAASSVH